MGSGEIKELKQENQQLRDEVVARDESIERLQIMMQKQREQYSRELVKVQGKHIKELDETRKEISRLSQMIKGLCMATTTKRTFPNGKAMSCCRFLN